MTLKHQREYGQVVTINSPCRDDPDAQFLRRIRLEDGREFQQFMRALSRSMAFVAMSAALAVVGPARERANLEPGASNWALDQL